LLIKIYANPQKKARGFLIFFVLGLKHGGNKRACPTGSRLREMSEVNP
jgi:hypothetical protein